MDEVRNMAADTIKSTNDFIVNFLGEYINDPDPQYAVMLKGKWGCGKTFFIKRWLEQYDGGYVDEDSDLISIKPIYVSLYGLKSIPEVKEALDREINPFFYTKVAQAAKDLCKLFGRVALKAKIDLNDGMSFSGTLDSLSVFRNDDIVKGLKFIVFDDIERCHIDMAQLLGFINYFVEHCGCHVVIVGDETHLDLKEKHRLDEFKEKTIGREFEIVPESDTAIDYFLSEIPKSSVLKSKLDIIIRCFHATGTDNLRLLRQCLRDFAGQLSLIEEHLLSDDSLFLQDFLCSFIAVYAEYNDKENHDFILDYAKGGYKFILKDKENDSKYHSIVNKYRHVNENSIHDILMLEHVKHIVGYITTGRQLADYITEQLHCQLDKKPAWERLDSYWKMSNDEFNAVYDLTMSDLLGNRIHNPYEIGFVICCFCKFDELSIRGFTAERIPEIKALIKSLVASMRNLSELYDVRAKVFNGFSRANSDNNNLQILSDIREFFVGEVERRSKELPDAMQIVLRELSDKNVDRLFYIDNDVYPDHSSSFHLRPILAEENPDELFNRIDICLMEAVMRLVYSFRSII